MGQNFDQAKCEDTFWPLPNILMASVFIYSAGKAGSWVEEKTECFPNSAWVCRVYICNKVSIVLDFTIFLVGLRPRICVKYFLSFPQKNLSPEKTEKNEIWIYFSIFEW